MRLTFDGQTIDNPTAADISRGIGTAPPPDGWSIELVAAEGSSIEADWTGDGDYHIAYVSGRTLFDGVRAVEARELAEILTLYLRGDDRWRSRLEWRQYEGAPVATPAGMPATWRMFWPVLIIPGLFIAFWLFSGHIDRWLGRVPWSSLPLPSWMDSTPSRVILGLFAVCVALVSVAALLKLLEARRAARWPKVVGRIVRSRTEFRQTYDTEINTPNHVRVADIAYEFEVAGTKHRGTRVSLAEKVPESEVPALLARYPEGKLVEVFHDPANPRKSTLERGMPGGAGLGCLALMAVGIAGVMAIMVLATQGPGWIAWAFPKAIVPLFVMFAIGGLMMLFIAATMLMDTYAARRWPTASATMTVSEVRQHASKEASIPVVEYTYSVAGRAYTSRTIRLDAEVGGSKAYAEKVASRYPVGGIVPVRYDPANPSRAALEHKAGLGWALLGLAAILLLLAAWAAGLLTEGPALRRR